MSYILHYNDKEPDSLRNLLIEYAGEPAQEAFMTGAEQLRQEGIREALTMLLHTRFNEVPTEIAARIEKAEKADLDHWLKRFATSDSLAQIFS